METEKIFFRRKLPHYQPKGAIFFITFRLAGSLPSAVIGQLQEEYESELRLLKKNSKSKNRKEEIYTFQKRYFARFDKFLDTCRDGSTHLSNPRIAQLTADAVQYWNQKRYELICFCIMPNHVHVVFNVGHRDTVSYKSPYILSPILSSIKRHTARQANLILKRKGKFWQKESYDHVVRDGKELTRIIRYVIENPVKAGLVRHWKDWKWTYINEKYLTM